MDLKSKLNTAKNMASETPISERLVPRQSVSTFVGDIDALTEQVFGNKLLDDGSGKAPYDPKAEMKMIQAGIPKDKLNSSKLPSAIKEAIASNPLIVTSTDPKMDAFTAKLAAVQGMQKAANIMNQLDEEDKEKENARKAALNENMQRGSVTIDYSLIKTIVENAVKSLKDEIKNELNESVNHNNMKNNDTSLKVMKMADKFLFLDSDNNIFECQMVYKGKNKTKKQ
jgi:hypothetical protein